MRRVIRKEVQLDWLEQKAARGGNRPGAGRPAKRGKTLVKRIPQQYADAIESLITHLDQQRDCQQLQSRVQIQDLDNREVMLTFNTEAQSDNKR